MEESENILNLKENGDSFDYHQELARSAFADMLHDTERNQKYSEGLKEAIEITKSRGLKAHVLDIGTGTGLLAMLAAKHGADSVTTIEAFSPVSHLARKIIEENGFKEKIKIINKHSTLVTVGPGGDMEQKANILVAEVLDTELIGEGAIKTYNSAHENLTVPGCLCVPDSALIYVQIADCPRMVDCNTFKSTGSLKCPENVTNCLGSHAIHDIQLSQLPLKDFTILSDPIEVCQVDFSGKSQIPEKETFVRDFTAIESGQANSAFFWWDIKMNETGSILLSCAPHWAHPDTEKLSGSSLETDRRNSIPWRDHWMQASFHLKSHKKLEKGEKLKITGSHDEFSWWFDLGDQNPHNQPFCAPNCSFHTFNSRNRILEINSRLEVGKIEENKNYLFVGDHNLGALEAALKSKTKIFVYQTESMWQRSFKNFIEANNLESKIEIFRYPDEIRGIHIDHVIAEPFYYNSVLPWDNITHFWYDLKNLQINHPILSPSKASIFAIPVFYLNLHKIRWPLKSTCEGFDHKIFDDAIELASTIADENVEPFSLWEYPCVALGKAVEIFSLSFYDKNIEESENVLNVDVFDESCNGLAFWTEWQIDDNNTLACGPATQPTSGTLLDWKPEHRQAVHLIPSSSVIGKKIEKIKVKTFYDKIDENLKMEFKYC